MATAEKNPAPEEPDLEKISPRGREKKCWSSFESFVARLSFGRDHVVTLWLLVFSFATA